jgi:protein bicaudal C
MTTSMLDSTPVRQRNQLSKFNDIETLLTGIGLQHHVQSFIDGEIDMTVFPTLTEQDLLNLGIKALGARRRIMMAVTEMSSRINMQHDMMQQQQQIHTTPPTPLRFNGSVAPGDERRSSSGGH